MSAGDRGTARPDGGAGHKLGSGAAGALIWLALAAGAAAAQECDRAALQAARARGGEAQLCVSGATGTARFHVEIADDEAERSRGLMGRESLAPDAGMLFLYPTPRVVAFWMHDTPLPLDMVFIDAEGRIARIAANARPYDETPIWSGGPVLAVLEIAGGRAAELGLAPGQRVVPLE